MSTERAWGKRACPGGAGASPRASALCLGKGCLALPFDVNSAPTPQVIFILLGYGAAAR